MNGVTVALTGRLGADAEFRSIAGGTAFLTFNVAVNDDKRVAAEEIEWVRCAVFGKDALPIASRLVKGVEVYVEGRARVDQWVSSDGQHRAVLTVNAWTVHPLGQIGRRRPPTEPIAVQAGSAGQVVQLAEHVRARQLAVAAGRDRRPRRGHHDDGDTAS